MADGLESEVKETFCQFSVVGIQFIMALGMYIYRSRV